MDRVDKLLQVRHVVDLNPHIQIDTACCAACDDRCLWFCPAGCFEAGPEGIAFQYEGCLECGSCRVLCPGVSWDYPAGGRGVTFRFG
ncbi:MAG: ferredoxin family protein [Propionibacteriaceae bacterium]|jgi:ferredoxin like protein|nr:ferredoxin family protein [Propionibacteriaceae bacterium]